MKKTTMFLLWVGAAISISEIYTGGLLAPLGFSSGLLAIVLGHLIGAGLLALSGYISFRQKRGAMDSVVFALGSGGGKIAALFNVVQLTGWTIVMIVQAAAAANALFPALPFAAVSLVLGIVVLVWALLFGTPAQWINSIIVVLLVLLCAILFAETAGTAAALVTESSATLPPPGFAVALELSIAMPVSWLPLVGDYSSKANEKICAAFMPFAGYFLGSVLMYAFGLYITIHSGGDFFTLIAASRFRAAACAIVVLSTLTTAFLDLYSAALSSAQFVKTKTPLMPILVIGIAAALLSAVFPFDRYGDFLTAFLSAIGMIFVPVYAYLIVRFLCGGKEVMRKNWRTINVQGAIIIVAGIIVYHLCTVYEADAPSLITIAAVALPTLLLSRRAA